MLMWMAVVSSPTKGYILATLDNFENPASIARFRHGMICPAQTVA